MSPLRVVAPVLVCAAVLVAGCSDEKPGPDVMPPASGPSRYVAMGDSYTSAPEVPDIVDEGCFRSDSNYPSLVAEQLDLSLDDVSCGGAATTALVGVQETTTGVVPPQFDALSKDTEVVTVGIGANDEGLFGELLATCLELGLAQTDGSPCRDQMTQGGSDRVLAAIAKIRARLTSALVGVKDRAPDAAVVLVGYPQIVPDHVRCEILPLTDGDYSYFRDVFVALGQATEQAAADADAIYVDVLAASDGHDICAGEDAWVSGYTENPGRPAAPMHPFAEEQEAVADLVVDALDDQD